MFSYKLKSALHYVSEAKHMVELNWTHPDQVSHYSYQNMATVLFLVHSLQCISIKYKYRQKI